MDEIVQMISTIGFPIVAVIGMAYFYMKMWTAQNQQNVQREEKLMALVRELSQNLANIGHIVDENTKVLAILTERVSELEEEIKRGDNK